MLTVGVLRETTSLLGYELYMQISREPSEPLARTQTLPTWQGERVIHRRLRKPIRLRFSGFALRALEVLADEQQHTLQSCLLRLCQDGAFLPSTTKPASIVPNAPISFQCASQGEGRRSLACEAPQSNLPCFDALPLVFLGRTDPSPEDARVSDVFLHALGTTHLGP